MRRVEIFTVTNPDDPEDRDIGKQFQLTEMPAARGEKWAMRAFLGLAKSGVDIPNDVQGLGLAGIAMLAFEALGGMPWEVLEPLMDEMMECVLFVPDPSKPAIMRKIMTDSDIEEITTLLALRRAIFDLHTGFFKRAAKLRALAAAKAAEAQKASQATPTSALSSGQ